MSTKTFRERARRHKPCSLSACLRPQRFEVDSATCLAFPTPSDALRLADGDECLTSRPLASAAGRAASPS
jgi:hypothetical protein